MKKTKQGVLHIGRPRIEHVDGMARVVASVVHGPIPDVEGTGGDVWFAVKEDYGPYLCHERGDAFVVGMLFYAMRLGLDIVSDAPVSEEILFKLRTYFIPSIAKNCEEMYPCAIEAEPGRDPLPNAGAVGTGISCGVDSLHAVLQQTNSPCPGLNLTHLVLNNVGAYAPRSRQFLWQREHGRAFAKEYGVPFVETDSNICQVFVFNCRWFHFTNTYMNAFAALCLQKLWGTFTIASGGWTFAFFTLSKILEEDSAVYDLLFLHAISTRRLQFLSGGGAETRYEKTLALADWPPARKWLHVCTDDSGPNCNVCVKCVRTLTTLDALGKLDAFKDVFDIAYYRANRPFYLKAAYYEWLRNGTVAMLDQTVAALRRDLTWRIKLPVWYTCLREKMRRCAALKKVYRWLVPSRPSDGSRARKESFGSLPARQRQ